MKDWERVVEMTMRRKRDMSILENQFRFMSGRSTMEVIHFIMRLLDEYRNRKRNLQMMFIDLKKAYDSP